MVRDPNRIPLKCLSRSNQWILPEPHTKSGAQFKSATLRNEVVANVFDRDGVDGVFRNVFCLVADPL